MKISHKIISATLLVAFLFNACAYDLSFAANVRSIASTDNLSIPLKTSDITGDLGRNRVGMAFQTLLAILDKEVPGITPDKYETALRTSQKAKILKAEDALRIKVFLNTVPRTNEPGAWFRCWILDNIIRGKRTATYYVNLIVKDGDVDIEVYTEEEFKRKAIIAKSASGRALMSETEYLETLSGLLDDLCREVNDYKGFFMDTDRELVLRLVRGEGSDSNPLYLRKRVEELLDSCSLETRQKVEELVRKKIDPDTYYNFVLKSLSRSGSDYDLEVRSYYQKAVFFLTLFRDRRIPTLFEYPLSLVRKPNAYDSRLLKNGIVSLRNKQVYCYDTPEELCASISEDGMKRLLDEGRDWIPDYTRRKVLSAKNSRERFENLEKSFGSLVIMQALLRLYDPVKLWDEPNMSAPISPEAPADGDRRFSASGNVSLSAPEDARLIRKAKWFISALSDIEIYLTVLAENRHGEDPAMMLGWLLDYIKEIAHPSNASHMFSQPYHPEEWPEAVYDIARLRNKIEFASRMMQENLPESEVYEKEKTYLLKCISTVRVPWELIDNISASIERFPKGKFLGSLQYPNDKFQDGDGATFKLSEAFKNGTANIVVLGKFGSSETLCSLDISFKDGSLHIKNLGGRNWKISNTIKDQHERLVRLLKNAEFGSLSFTYFPSDNDLMVVYIIKDRYDAKPRKTRTVYDLYIHDSTVRSRLSASGAESNGGEESQFRGDRIKELREYAAGENRAAARYRKALLEDGSHLLIIEGENIPRKVVEEHIANADRRAVEFTTEANRLALLENRDRMKKLEVARDIVSELERVLGEDREDLVMVYGENISRREAEKDLERHRNQVRDLNDATRFSASGKPSESQASLPAITASEAIRLKKIADIQLLAGHVGPDIAVGCQLFVPQTLLSNKDCDVINNKHDNRFEAIAFNGRDVADSILSQVKDKDRAIALIPKETADKNSDLLEKMKAAGVRFLITRDSDINELKGLAMNAKEPYLVNIFATMLIARSITSDMAKDSPLYQLLSYYLQRQFDLEDGITVDDYINAIAIMDIAKLIKGYLAPIKAFRGEDLVEKHHNIAATLIAA